MKTLRNISFLVVLLCAIVPATSAQTTQIADDDGWCDDSTWNTNREKYCEIRETTLETRKLLQVDGQMNGGISVKGWDRSEIRIVAKVETTANSMKRAEAIAEAVDIRTKGVIETSEPSKLGRRESISVSYRIYVPTQANLKLTTYNGGISIQEVSGDIQFAALNGGVRLERLAGDVKGKTTNGGLKVVLDGSQWNGSGLDVATTNGGVTVNVPEGYNAEFETGTVNGRVDLDFPMTVSGRINRNIRTTLGDGGAPIRVRTTNGGVSIRRAD